MDPHRSFGDFTEDAYRELLRLAAQSYSFVRFLDALDAPPRSILWRHDVDFSPHRALALARIEADEGARATYFVYLHSPHYNALEGVVVERFREVVALGHDLGVHFDPNFHARRDPEEALATERRLLEDVFEAPIESFSLHAPDLAGWDPRDARVAGLVNAYAAPLKERFAYVSDSNGYWRYRRLYDVLEAAEEERLQVLTHPEWWVPQALSPRDRISRAIDGRAAYQHAHYDRVLDQMGRENIR